MIRLGVIGDHSTDQSTLLKLLKMKDISITGVFSTDEIQLPSNIPLCYSVLNLIENSDAILILSKNVIGIEMTKQIIRNSKHLFFSIIPDFSMSEMKELLNLEKEAGIITHLYNPLESLIRSEKEENEFNGSKLINLRTSFSQNQHNANEILHLIVSCSLKFKSNNKRADVFALKNIHGELIFHLRNEYENGTVCNITITSSKSPTEIEIFEKHQTDKIVFPNSLFSEDSDSKLIQSIKDFILRIKNENKEKGSFEDLYHGKRLLIETLDRLKITDITF